MTTNQAEPAEQMIARLEADLKTAKEVEFALRNAHTAAENEIIQPLRKQVEQLEARLAAANSLLAYRANRIVQLQAQQFDPLRVMIEPLRKASRAAIADATHHMEDPNAFAAASTASTVLAYLSDALAIAVEPVEGAEPESREK